MSVEDVRNAVLAELAVGKILVLADEPPRPSRPPKTQEEERAIIEKYANPASFPVL